MFIKSRNYGSCIQKVRIEVGLASGLEKDDEAFITLREIPTIQMMELKDAYEKGEKELMGFFRELLPAIIVDHNFYVTEQLRMTGAELRDLVFDSLELTQKVIGGYTEAAFFTRAQRTGGSSHPSAPKSSAEDTAPSCTGSTGAGSAG
jgi:hypothetical protein